MGRVHLSVPHTGQIEVHEAPSPNQPRLYLPSVVQAGRALRLQLALKRAIDVAGAATLLFIMLPLMCLIALTVNLTSPGGIIFRQRRTGRDGRLFTILKFRSMATGDAQVHPGMALNCSDASRVTRVGKVLRSTGLDELPQLVNILHGEMSFVGPRPDLPHHTERYSEFQKQRLRMRPGITGWAQVNGRTRIAWEDRIRLDVEYIRNWSLLLDLMVISKTIAVVLSGDAAPPGR